MCAAREFVTRALAGMRAGVIAQSAHSARGPASVSVRGMRYPMAATLAIALLAPGGARAADCQAASDVRLLPLVELYTAEGCSDCPPADRWLSDLSRSLPADEAALLAFHVDYWDQEGWPDRFADKRHSQRQDLRITLSGKRVTYTPQVMVGRSTNVGWRSAAKFGALLRQERTREAPVALAMRITRSPNALDVAVDAGRARQAGAADAAEPALVWLALYQDGLTSHIAEGENKGKTLHHDRVVRALAGPWRMDTAEIAQRARIPLPGDAEPAKMGLVLFAESGTTGEGLQALALPLTRCGVPATGAPESGTSES
jgi:hypothetical protein